MKREMTRSLVTSGLVAAQYVVLTLLSAMVGLASGALQVRLSEALTILPCFSRASIWGLFVGCIIANVITGAFLWDIIFGSLATLIGAIGTYYWRKNKYMAVLSPILANSLIIPVILINVYEIDVAYLLLVLSVGAGEVISCGVLGLFLYSFIKRNPWFF